MKKNINLRKIKEELEKLEEGYLIKDCNLFYLSNKIRVHSSKELKKIESINLCSIEGVYHLNDIEVPTKLAFSLKEQYGDDVSNLLLIMSDGKWFELWIEKLKG